jgi:hypothetical protein
MVARTVLIFRSHGVLADGLAEGTVRAFARQAGAHYRANPYHNFAHAFTVLHTTQLLLRSSRVRVSGGAGAGLAALCNARWRCAMPFLFCYWSA